MEYISFVESIIFETEGDTFRVEARTVVTAWNIGENNQDELDNQDEWEISEHVDFPVPDDW